MRRFWTLHVSFLYISTCISQSGDCGERLQTDNACCVDFYLDPNLKTCRPCNGSFGHNCSLRCPDGYYGHGCRQKCDCVNNQRCDPKSGCFFWKNRDEEKNHSAAMDTKHIVLLVSSICVVLTTVIGIIVYALMRKKRRRMMTGCDENISNEVRVSQRVDCSIATFFTNYPSTHTFAEDITKEYKHEFIKYRNADRSLTMEDRQHCYGGRRQLRMEANAMLQATELNELPKSTPRKPMRVFEAEIRGTEFDAQ